MKSPTAKMVAFTLLLALFQFSPPTMAQVERADAKTGDSRQVKAVRLLNVGNSFSGNATHYLSNMVAAAGHKLVHHQASIGGGTMAQHWGKARTNELNPTEPMGLYGKKSLKQELQAEPWDFVTIQQASIESHDVTTYRPYAKQLQEYIKRYAPKAEVVVHQTWPYRVDDPRFSGKSSKPGEPASQDQMYRQLTNAYAIIAAELGDHIIPVGDAFHFANSDPTWGFKPDTRFDLKSAQEPALPNQTHSLNVGWRWVEGKDGRKTLAMDGHHASVAGQYLGACVFFEFLYRESVVGNQFVPPGLDKEYAAFLQQTAHRAMAQGGGNKAKGIEPQSQ